MNALTVPELNSKEQPSQSSPSTDCIIPKNEINEPVKLQPSKLSSYFFAPSDGLVQGTTPEMKRSYQEWKGKNTILCKGRIIGGPELFKLYRTLALVLVPCLMFDIYVAEVFYSK